MTRETHEFGDDATYSSMENKKAKAIRDARRNRLIAIAVVVLLVIGTLIVALVVLPRYNIYRREMSGKAQLAEAEWNRQIAVKEAQAKADSAVLLAEAEIARAEGVAEANRIIGDSLKGNPEYLWYLWIDGLNDGTGETIYVPTEANLPVLEASRFGSLNGTGEGK